MEDPVYKPPLLLLLIYNLRRSDTGRTTRKKRCPLTGAKSGSSTVIRLSASSLAVPMAGSTRREASFQATRRSSPSKSGASSPLLLYKIQVYTNTNRLFRFFPGRFKPDKEGEIIQYTGISQSACREMAVSTYLRFEFFGA